MLVDSHCHLDFPDFSTELDAVIGRARAAGIGRIVTISTRVKRHAQVLAIAEKFTEVFCSVGTHPHYADEEPDVDPQKLVGLAKHPKIVAIGEAGLDYFRNNSPRRPPVSASTSQLRARRACPW
jgi:TatD DNase family protein